MPAVPPAPQWIAATIPKRGNQAAENEDATASAPDALRFAVSDGATEGWESGPWALRLATSYVSGPPTPTDFADWLTAVRKWEPPAPPGEVPWYAEEKREQGSFATLAGLELRRSRQTTGWAWRSVMIGDSCLLQVRGEKVVLAVPLTSPKEFGNRPALVPSAGERPCPDPEWFAGRAEPGDLFLLATDAAAARLLDPQALAPGLVAIRAALAARAAPELAEWCKTVQDTTNDDVSVLAVSLPLVPSKK